MKPVVLRFVPALTVAALLVLAAFAGGARPGRAASATADVMNCAAGQLSGADGLFNIANGTGVRQPFDGMVPVAACSLSLDYSWTSAQFQVLFWDPLALAPAAGEIALRSIGYDTSHMIENHLGTSFSPPLVTQSVYGVAEPGRTSLALDYAALNAFYSQGVHYWTDGPAAMPAAQSYNGNVVTPLPGPHPVLAAGFCPWPGPDSLLVLQSVVKQDVAWGFAPHDFVQRFRVPRRCSVSHVELAFAVNSNLYSLQVGHIAIVDAAGALDPPPTSFPPAMAEADFVHYVTSPTWDSHYDFGRTLVLEPNHDYWMWVYTGFTYNLYAKHKTGGESIAFAQDIGGLYTRTGPFQAWISGPGYALDFRIIGTPLAATVSVPPPAVARGLRLAAEPNPARAATTLRWSGARERARLEILDTRGRRVASYDGAGGEGAWRWNGVADSGQPLPAGIYFVRAMDRDGTAGIARLVLVR